MPEVDRLRSIPRFCVRRYEALRRIHASRVATGALVECLYRGILPDISDGLVPALEVVKEGTLPAEVLSSRSAMIRPRAAAIACFILEPRSLPTEVDAKFASACRGLGLDSAEVLEACEAPPLAELAEFLGTEQTRVGRTRRRTAAACDPTELYEVRLSRYFAGRRRVHGFLADAFLWASAAGEGPPAPRRPRGYVARTIDLGSIATNLASLVELLEYPGLCEDGV
jgi:hypothetical protein